VNLCSWETNLAIHTVIEDKRYSGIARADNDRFLIIAVQARFGLWDLDKGMKIVCPNITPVDVLRCGRGGQIATIGGEVLSIWSLDTIAGQSKSLEGSTEKSISGLGQHPAGFIVQAANVNSYIAGVTTMR
jgi:tricorn protease-like protein